MNKSESNRVCVSGRVFRPPVYSHYLFGEAFYQMHVSVPRLSGTEDILPITFSERLVGQNMPAEGDWVSVSGQLRSYNKQIDGYNRLIITVFSRVIAPACGQEDAENEITLEGYICKPVVYRTTPFSREIADVLLAVNRSYNKSDYLPCIAWGRNARFVEGLSIGSHVRVTGRVQSRDYQKKLNDGETVIRTAYEVSISSVEVME